MVSITLHAAFVIIAIFVIYVTTRGAEQKGEVDFLSGGGGGTDGNTQIHKRRQKMMMNSSMAVRLSSTAQSGVSLPDTSATLSSLSSFTMTSGMMSGTPGTGGGFGGGKGLGRGTGTGGGFGPGVGPGFVAMFGRKLQAKRLGVVLDISKSMHPYLATVVREADKIGTGAPVICYYGCGLTTPKVKLRDKAQPTEGREFDHFWHRMPNGPKPDENIEVDLKQPLPLQEIYDVLHKRKDTFYFEKRGIGNAWLALMTPELRKVDAVYWFADFKDAVDAEQLNEIAGEFERRKQKLYIHSSGDGAKSLDEIMDAIVKPTGGERIKADLGRAPAKGDKPKRK